MTIVYKVLGQSMTGSTRTFAAITNKAITTNVATITTAAVHGLAVGNVVSIFGVDSIHDGTHVVATVPTTSTFTYLSSTATQSTTAVTPNATLIRTHDIGGVVSANKYSTGSNAILTTGSAHGLAVNDWVYVDVGDANMNGLVKVISAPSTTTFTYAKIATAVTSTAVTTGAIGKVMPASWTTLYTVPSPRSTVISTILITNLTGYSASYRIAISPNTTPTSSEIIVFDNAVAANDSTTLTLGITMEEAKKMLVISNSPEIVFSVYGSENF
jgi:hypothetical protein